MQIEAVCSLVIVFAGRSRDYFSGTVGGRATAAAAAPFLVLGIFFSGVADTKGAKSIGE